MFRTRLPMTGLAPLADGSDDRLDDSPDSGADHRFDGGSGDGSGDADRAAEAPAPDDDDRTPLMALMLGGLGAGAMAAGHAGGAAAMPALIAGGPGDAKPGALPLPVVPARPHEAAMEGGTPSTATAVLGLQRIAATAPDGRPLTNDGTVLVSGLEPNGRWWYSFDDGATWTQGELASIPGRVAAATGDGPKQVRVYQSDAAGHESGQAELAFVLDTTPPAGPRISLVNDTGLSATDGITTDPRMRIDRRDPTTTLELSINNGAFFPWTGDDVPASLFDQLQGRVTVAVAQVDAAGNQSIPTTVMIELDRDWPQPPHLELATAAMPNAVLAA